ncbi:thioesterase family protein [Thermodesulforhabdus norvegica]|uniref:Thioesterase superfamily n=1 Tax=Thermodesulforhabdus norvegica TaxID=39841 RepID=A0A1I4W321_9BACT|nr:thioesterase family protein [Thermodesulforhabdus norvegica]SFN07626.1 Thioesterase superfamily [Thermodesulforhabdus norvegica]
MEKSLQPGLKGTAEAEVVAPLTAISMKSGDVEVYATPAMIALMEEAAVACVRDHLPEGQTSVGTYIEVHHRAATPPGMKVKAEAILEAVDGRKLTFKVTAHDELDLIGEGRHERVIVPRDKFMEKVKTKGQKDR